MASAASSSPTPARFITVSTSESVTMATSCPSLTHVTSLFTCGEHHSRGHRIHTHVPSQLPEYLNTKRKNTQACASLHASGMLGAEAFEASGFYHTLPHSSTEAFEASGLRV
jgi:hypothetical protein